MSLYSNKIILIGGSGFLGQNFSRLLEERNIDTIASLSKEFIVMYEAYLEGKNPAEVLAKRKIDPDLDMGYLGKIDDARRLFERLYKNPSQP